ncbi:hypothetical protein IV203_028522 [Nitzschia inconspicua]|uniref:Uncharacterized protein n=1 Tax=Nitzschia inconspicua TaxID=303405 RepID=A0A9K3LPR3_9STRA|nr:hypothetical protein IV203_028522 [Nitzschia inconspicua]
MVTISFEDSPPERIQRREEHVPIPSSDEHGHDGTSMDDGDSSQSESTSTPAASSSSSSSIPLLLSEQDNYVFCNLNKDLTDFLAERIEQTLQNTVVEGLPLLENGPAKTKLQETLVYKFVRNIDVLEAYCAQNVLTLRKHAPATRKRIVQVLKHGKGSLSSIPSFDDSNSISNSDTVIIPTKDMIPSSADSKTLQDDLEQLQERLNAARLVRNDLLVQQKSLERAQSITHRLMETLEQHKPMIDTDRTSSTIVQQVNTVVMDGNSVHELTEEAKTILDKLKRQEKRPSSSQPEEQEFDDPFFSNTMVKQPRLSLEEVYNRDRKELGLLRDTTNSSDKGNRVSPSAKLIAFKNLLKGKSEVKNNTTQ